MKKQLIKYVALAGLGLNLPFLTPVKGTDVAKGSGLIQLWQEIPEGQEKPKNVSEEELRERLYCKANHQLSAGQGINEFDTYVNSCYVDDAYYLDETNGSYKILVSGYEGWVKKNESQTIELKFYVDKNGREVSTSKKGTWKTYTYEVQTTATLVPFSESGSYKLPSDANSFEGDSYLKSAKAFEGDNSLLGKVTQWLGIKKTLAVESPSFYRNENGSLVHYISTNVTKSNSYNALTIGKAPTWMENEKTYYSYDGIYFYDSLSDIDVFGSGAINEGTPYFNYYQYVPIRSISNITAHDMDYYLRKQGYSEKPDGYPASSNESQLVNEGSSFIDAQDNYHINGVLQFAMATHESGWGRSSLSIKKNNLFGINAIDSSPTESANAFDSVPSVIDYHAQRYLSWGYSDPLGDTRYYGFYLGNKSGGMNVKYASDPYWGEKIAGIYYSLDKLSGYRDYESTSFGMILYEDGVPIYQESSTDSPVIYQTKNKRNGHSIPYYPVILIGEVGDFYEVMLDTALDVNREPNYRLPYTGIRERGYILKEDIHFLNTGEVVGTPQKNESSYRPSDESTGAGTTTQTKPTVNTESSYVVSGSGIPLEETEDTVEGTVTLDALSVRSEASARGKVIGRLAKNEKIKIVGQEGKWIMFDFQGEVAYVSEAYVKLEQETQQVSGQTEQVGLDGVSQLTTRVGNKDVIEVGYAITDGLNVRADATTSSTIIDVLNEGEKVEIVGQKGPFYEINYESGTAYVSSQYISLTPPVDEEDDSNDDSDEDKIPTIVIKVGYVATNGVQLNVYGDLSDTSSTKIIGTLPHGTEVEVLKIIKDMYMIKYKGGIGYIEKKYISNKKPSTNTGSSSNNNSSNNSSNNSNNNSNNSSNNNSSNNNSSNGNSNAGGNNSSNQSSNNSNSSGNNGLGNNDDNQSGTQVEDWVGSQEPTTEEEEELIIPNTEGQVLEFKEELGKIDYRFVQAKLDGGVLYLIGRVSADSIELTDEKGLTKSFLVVDSTSQKIVKRVDLKYQEATNLLKEGNDAYKFELAFPLYKLQTGIYDLKMLLEKDGLQTITPINDNQLAGYRIIFDGMTYSVKEITSSTGVTSLQLTVTENEKEKEELEEVILEESLEEEMAEEEAGKSTFMDKIKGFFEDFKSFFVNLFDRVLGLFGLDDASEEDVATDELEEETPEEENTIEEETLETEEELFDNQISIIEGESEEEVLEDEEELFDNQISIIEGEAEEEEEEEETPESEEGLFDNQTSVIEIGTQKDEE